MQVYFSQLLASRVRFARMLLDFAKVCLCRVVSHPNSRTPISQSRMRANVLTEQICHRPQYIHIQAKKMKHSRLDYNFDPITCLELISLCQICVCTAHQVHVSTGQTQRVTVDIPITGLEMWSSSENRWHTCTV